MFSFPIIFNSALLKLFKPAEIRFFEAAAIDFGSFNKNLNAADFETEG